MTRTHVHIYQAIHIMMTQSRFQQSYCTDGGSKYCAQLEKHLKHTQRVNKATSLQQQNGRWPRLKKKVHDDKESLHRNPCTEFKDHLPVQATFICTRWYHFVPTYHQQVRSFEQLLMNCKRKSTVLTMVSIWHLLQNALHQISFPFYESQKERKHIYQHPLSQHLS